MQSSTVQPPAGMEMPIPNDGVSVPQSNLNKTGNGAVHRILSGNRLHLQHGPIDLIIVVDGPEQVQNEAFDRAIHRFDPILEELVAELPILKTSWNPSFPNLKGRVAKRMLEAVQGLDGFITPMAAVAGAVADEIRDVMLEVPGIRRLMVNNGGDIAFDLTPGTECRFGVFELKEASLSSKTPKRHSVPGVKSKAMSPPLLTISRRIPGTSSITSRISSATAPATAAIGVMKPSKP